MILSKVFISIILETHRFYFPPFTLTDPPAKFSYDLFIAQFPKEKATAAEHNDILCISLKLSEDAQEIMC